MDTENRSLIERNAAIILAGMYALPDGERFAEPVKVAVNLAMSIHSEVSKQTEDR